MFIKKRIFVVRPIVCESEVTVYKRKHKPLTQAENVCKAPVRGAVRGGTGEPGRTYLHAGHIHGVESFSTKPHWYQDDHGLPFGRGV